MSTDRGDGILNHTLNLFFEYPQTEDGILSHTKQFLNINIQTGRLNSQSHTQIIFLQVPPIVVKLHF